jgi:DNA-binding response OmpR family regulator
MASYAPAILLVHDDARLTGAFTALGWRVVVATTRANAVLELEAGSAGGEFDVVVAGWDTPHAIGRALYQWVLVNRYPMRGRFVFLAADVPDAFEDIVQGRCVCVPGGEVDDIVRAVKAVVHRASQARELEWAEREWFDDDMPRLLIIDDEPLHLGYLCRMFRAAGFAVANADSGNAATDMLEQSSASYDVLLIDWFMADGSGSEFYDWLRAHRPELTDRCVFLSGLVGANLDFIRKQVPECTVLPKGQDSDALLRTVVAMARLSRAG